MVFQSIEADGRSFGVITRIACSAHRRAERENAVLRRANEILKSASASFARKLDPRPPR